MSPVETQCRGQLGVLLLILSQPELLAGFPFLLLGLLAASRMTDQRPGLPGPMPFGADIWTVQGRLRLLVTPAGDMAFPVPSANCHCLTRTPPLQRLRAAGCHVSLSWKTNLTKDPEEKMETRHRAWQRQSWRETEMEVERPGSKRGGKQNYRQQR